MVPFSTGPDARPPSAVAVGILVFLLPPLVTVALYLPSGLLMPARLVTFCLAALATWQVTRIRRLLAPRTVIVSGGVFAVLTLFGGIAMGRYQGRTSYTDAVQLGFICMTMLALAILTTRRRILLSLLGGWLLAAVLAAAVGVWELTTNNHLPGNSPARQFGHLPGWNEISSFFDNPNLYAYHLALSLLLLPLAWHLVPGWWRSGVITFGVLLLALLFATSGRMALVSLLVGSVWWALRTSWGRVGVIVGIAVTGATMALKLPPGWTVYRFIYVALDGLQWEGKSTWVRAQMVKSGWWMTQQSDYLGVGPGGFAIRALDPANPYRYEQLNNAHWGMIEVLAEYGIVSLLAIVAGLVLALIMMARSLRSIPADATFDRAVAHAASIVALTVPIISLSHSTWLRQPLTAVHLGTLAALLAWTEICASRHRRDC